MNTRPTPSVVADEELVKRVAKAIRHEDGGHIVPAELEYYRRFARAALAASDRDVLVGALTDARNNILSLLGGFRDDMPDAAVKLFQAQVRQIDAALVPLGGGADQGSAVAGTCFGQPAG